MLTGSPSAIITLGIGSWGSPGLVLSMGYGIGEQGDPKYPGSGTFEYAGMTGTFEYAGMTGEFEGGN